MKLSISSQGIHFLREVSQEKKNRKRKKLLIQTQTEGFNPPETPPEKSKSIKKSEKSSVTKSIESSSIFLDQSNKTPKPLKLSKTLLKKDSFLFKNRKRSSNYLLSSFKEPENSELKSFYEQCQDIVKGAEEGNIFKDSAYLDRRFKKIKQIVMNKNQVNIHKNHFYQKSFKMKKQQGYRSAMTSKAGDKQKKQLFYSTASSGRKNSTFFKKMKKLNKSIKFYNSRSKESKLRIGDFSKEAMRVHDLQRLKSRYSHQNDKFLRRMSRIREKTTKKEETERETNPEQVRRILKSAKIIQKKFDGVIKRVRARDLGIETADETPDDAYFKPYHRSSSTRGKVKFNFKARREKSYERTIRNSKVNVKRRRTDRDMHSFNDLKTNTGEVDQVNYMANFDVKTGMKMS